MSTSPLPSLGDEVARALAEQDPEGAPRFERSQIRDVLALLILRRGRPSSTLPPELLHLVGEFSAAADLLNATPAEVPGKLDVYFARHPVNAELLARFKRAGEL